MAEIHDLLENIRPRTDVPWDVYSAVISLRAAFSDKDAEIDRLRAQLVEAKRLLIERSFGDGITIAEDQLLSRIKQTTEGQLAGLIMDADLPKRQHAEIDRLRAELAEAKLERDTALTDRHDTIQDLRTENEALSKRVGELSTDHLFSEVKRLREACQQFRAHAEQAEKRVAELEAQLPDEMKHCTIQFKECEKGHGWLTATNWVQHGCPTCHAEQAEKRVGELADKGTLSALRDANTRAEQAEAQLAIAREALEAMLRIYDDGETVSPNSARAKARAAIAKATSHQQSEEG